MSTIGIPGLLITLVVLAGIYFFIRHLINLSNRNKDL